MHGRLGLVTSKDMTSHFIGRREPIIFLHRNSYLTAMKSMENCFTKLKESEKKTKSHEATKITAKDRVKQYSAGTFHEESGLLFCTVCNVVLEHSRKSVLDRHLEAASHQKRLNLPGTSRGKQKTLKTSFKCSNSAQEERIKVCQSTGEASLFVL